MVTMRKPTEFEIKVYALCSQVPRGMVTTYGAIAKALDCKAYQAIGSALNRNPYSAFSQASQQPLQNHHVFTNRQAASNLVVPCHRVVNSKGSMSGFAFGIEKKVELLVEEGITIENGRIINLESVLFIPSFEGNPHTTFLN